MTQQIFKRLPENDRHITPMEMQVGYSYYGSRRTIVKLYFIIDYLTIENRIIERVI